MSGPPTHDTPAAGRPEEVLLAIRRLFETAGRGWKEVAHPPVRTAEEAARLRGTPLDVGAKTILMKADDRFLLLALSASDSLRARSVRRSLGVRRTRFATPDELLDLLGLEPGGVPPFGRPVLPVELYADPGLSTRPILAFTPGVRDRSFVVSGADWRALARPEIARLT